MVYGMQITIVTGVISTNKHHWQGTILYIYIYTCVWFISLYYNRGYIIGIFLPGIEIHILTKSSGLAESTPSQPTVTPQRFAETSQSSPWRFRQCYTSIMYQILYIYMYIFFYMDIIYIYINIYIYIYYNYTLHDITIMNGVRCFFCE